MSIRLLYATLFHVSKSIKIKGHGFTLIELLIAIGILAIIVTITSSLFIDSYKNSKRYALQNSVYEDARFIMNQLANEISNNRIDYDEYYNQLVLGNAPTYGQNFGKYYARFFNPGSDNALGYDCNDGTRNGLNCTVIRTTLDTQTGQNPYSGNPAGDNPVTANAFNVGAAATTYTGNELYLISADSLTKTMYARERIGGTNAEPIWALSKVKMTGRDALNSDGIIDSFSCAEGFECGSNGTTCDEATAAGKPSKNDDLNPSNESFTNTCDNAENGFAHDFVPVSPLRVDVMSVQFQIAPVEDPHYAFAELAVQQQPHVTISMTVRPNPALVQDAKAFTPFTISRTVASNKSTN